MKLYLKYGVSYCCRWLIVTLTIEFVVVYIHGKYVVAYGCYFVFVKNYLVQGRHLWVL